MEERDERGDRGVVLLLLLDKIRVTHRSYSCSCTNWCVIACKEKVQVLLVVVVELVVNK